jgi:hypothetical protein
MIRRDANYRRSGAWLGALVVGGALVGASAAWGQAWVPDDEGTCVTCHEVEPDEELAVPVPEWRESVHAPHAVSCDACHGGDPRIEDADDSMSEEAGFLELPSWTEMADHCGLCHEEMAATWNAGRFGRAMAAQRVATCADCHMQDGHRILAAVPEEIITSETCPDCPTLDAPEAALASLLAVADAERELRAGISVVEDKGIDMTDFRIGLSQVHGAFARTVHEFDDESLVAARALALTQYRGLGESVAALEVEADGRRRLGLGLIAALALLFVALFGSLRTLGREDP